MKVNKNFLTMLLIMCGSSYSQEFQVPESAVFDSLSHRYFISNYKGGSIIQIDSNGTKTYFQQGLTKPLGMILHDNTVYVAENLKTIRGFDITDGRCWNCGSMKRCF